MKTNNQTLIARTMATFAEHRRQRRIHNAVRGFGDHMLADIGLERDDQGALRKAR